MLQSLKALIALIITAYERLKGTKTVVEIKSPENALGSLKGFVVRGYQITIYCQRKEYLVKYDGKMVPNKKFRVYRVFSAVTSDAPYALRKACELDIDIPAFVHPWATTAEIRRTAVNAYIDLLNRRMERAE